MSRDKVYIVGVAPGGASSLQPRIRRIVQQAGIVFGGERLLRMFPSISGQKVTIKNNLSEVTDLIMTNLGHKRAVVLASGDPGFYGIASYLTSKLGKHIIEVIPNVSAMQVAFALIKESWEDAALVSVHSRPIEDIVDTVYSNHKIGIFTDDEHTPAAIARVLLEHGVDGYQAYVCQNLGRKDEKVIETDLHGLCQMKFSPLNVLILLRVQQKKPAGNPCLRSLGISDEEFYQRKPKEGLITKLEVRAVSLAKLCLTEHSIVWDVGAGSGAISIEASLLAWRGRIFAIEKNSEDVANIRKNIRQFGRHNIKVIQTVAPANLEELPDPTAVFVGGSSGQLAGILHLACRRLKPGGRVVVNAATLENLLEAVENLKTNGFVVETTLVNVARSKEILDLTRLEALNPVFIVTGWRQAEGADGSGH